MFALGGNDEVHSGTGNDFLDGGPGGFDRLFGEAGNDELTLATSDGGGVASGGDGGLFGSNTSFNNSDNSLRGDAGIDELHADKVGSSMNGGDGSDRYIPCSFSYQVCEAQGLPASVMFTTSLILKTLSQVLRPSRALRRTSCGPWQNLYKVK